MELDELSELLDRATEAVKRDLSHIFREVNVRKLTEKSARDLVAYLKVLTDIKADQLDDEEKLKAAVEKVLNEQKSK